MVYATVQQKWRQCIRVDNLIILRHWEVLHSVGSMLFNQFRDTTFDYAIPPLASPIRTWHQNKPTNAAYSSIYMLWLLIPPIGFPPSPEKRGRTSSSFFCRFCFFVYVWIYHFKNTFSLASQILSFFFLFKLSFANTTIFFLYYDRKRTNSASG